MEKSIISLEDSLDSVFGLSSKDWKLYSPLTLAYLGDAVYEMVIRTICVKRTNMQTQKLHRKVTGYVSAKAQAKMMDALIGELTEEEEAQEREEAKIDRLNPQDPRFYLTTYYVEITKGTQIDRLSYVKDIQDDKDASNELYRKIQITGNVDVNTPGTYELTYYVVDSNGNASNGAVLTIVVK